MARRPTLFVSIDRDKQARANALSCGFLANARYRPGRADGLCKPPQRPDCVADDAVSCEPVSAPNSLLTGKLTGNFAESGHPPRFSCLIGARIQWLAAEFPTQRNSEFSNTYQRILFGEQGKSSQTTQRGPLNCDPTPCMRRANRPSQHVRSASNSDRIGGS